MQPITWNDELSLGIGLIDDCHKALIDIANDLIKAANMGRKPRTLTHHITKLREQAVAHIETEESIMASRRYEHRSRHSLENERFKVAMKQLHHRLKTAENVTSRDVESLTSSLVHHIKDSNQAITGSMNCRERHAC